MADDPPIPPLLPFPRRIERLPGDLVVNGLSLEGPPRVLRAFAVLSEELAAIATSAGVETPVRVTSSEKLAEEAYVLTVRPDGIEIEAGNAGLPWAISTLRQLLAGASPAGSQRGRLLPAVRIQDEPAFSWRGFQLDCSRHFISKKTILRYLDLLALFKLNRFHWHLTDDQGWRIEILKHPRLVEVGAWRGTVHTRYGGYYSQDDVREVVAYAADRGITVVPEIEMPGHATAALAAYPELGCTKGPYTVETGWGIFQNNLNAGDERVYAFIDDVIAEVAELFPSPWIHLGADECQKDQWKACPDCQAMIRKQGLADEFELQSYFIKRVLGILKRHGRTGIGWDEVLEGGLPDGIIVQAWRTRTAAGEAARQKHAAISSPKDVSYFDFGVSCIDLADVYRFNPVPAGLEPELHPLILGGECLVWTEYISEQSLDHMVFPRVIGFAEALWQKPDERQPFDAFHEALERMIPALRSRWKLAPGPAFPSGDRLLGLMGRIR